MFKSDSFARRIPQAVWHYGLAVTSVAVALVITQSLEPYTTLRTPLFYAAILITAWIGGIGPGVLAVAIATLALGYYFSPPGHLLGPDAIDLPFILFFSLSAILITWVSARRKAVEEALKRAHDNLEANVKERTAALQRTNEVLQIEITEHLRSESERRKSEERWQAVFANSAVGITLTDLDGRFMAANTAYQKMLGYSEDELRALTFLDITHRDDRDSSWELIRTLLEGRQSFFEVEKRYWRKNGDLIWAHAHVSLIPGTESIPQFLIGVVEDITERKRAEEELRRSEAYLSEGQRLTHTGSWAWNVATRENVYWSQEHYRIFGFDPEKESSSYQSALQRVFPDDLPGFEETFATAVREKKDFERDFRIVLPDGSMRYLHSIGHPIIDQSGEVIEFIGTCMDLTERKHTEEGLQRAQAELAHVTRLTTLGELTASIAHEVNQPLAAVALNANACLRWLAGESPNLTESRQAIQRIVREANRASEVIARIRALARKSPPRRDRVVINEVLLEVIALARGEVRRNHVNLHTQLADDLQLVLADRVQLQQVILNLIINSIEAMSEVSQGRRELMISSAKHENTGVLVAVRDTGVGVDTNHLDQLFDAFYTTKPDGMGMGLAISRSIIEAHGGRLWATAAKPSGAVLQFTLPVDGEGGL
ncbi:MAG: PAS domain S-box protein [Blastocatellia bacterium]